MCDSLVKSNKKEMKRMVIYDRNSKKQYNDVTL